MPARRAQRWTAGAVRQLIADTPSLTPRYELVDGELLVTPAPTPSHQMAVALLLGALLPYCAREGIGVPLTSPSDIELEEEDVRQPDVFVLPIAEWKRVARDGFPARELLLAIEVLSPSTARTDRVTKRAVYQRHVQEYWIVDIDAHIVERWRSGDTRPEIVADMLTWQPEHTASRFEMELSCRKTSGQRFSCLTRSSSTTIRRTTPQ